MKKLFLLAAIAFTAALPGTTARAQGYIGFALGNALMGPSLAEDSINYWNDITYGRPGTCVSAYCAPQKEGSGAAKLFGGYGISPNFAVEGFAAHLGSFGSSANDGAGVASYVSADIGTIGVAAVGIIPHSAGAGAFSGKIGLHSWSVDGSVDLLDTGPGGGTMTGGYSRSGTDMMFGIGSEFAIDSNATLRIELELFDVNTEDSDMAVLLFTVGGLYRF